jgi:predicted amidohydrolase
MFQQVRVAAITFVPKKFDLDGNGDRLEANFLRAAKRGAQLALAPEEALDGYPVPDVTSGAISPERMLDAAIAIDDSRIKRFQKLAKKLKMCLAFGFLERVGKELFNCAIFIDHTGVLCGRYHKMILAEGHEPGQWHNRLGKRSRAFETPFGRCGFMICNDRWNPGLARIPVLDGARYMLIPSYGEKKEKQDRAVMAIARENGIPILEANVGLLLLISKGEVVKRVKKDTAMIVGEMAIPVPPSKANVRHQEKRFFEWREVEMLRRYRRRLKTANYGPSTHSNGFE